MNYDYLKKSVLVRNWYALYDLVGWRANIMYVGWYVYFDKGELKAKLNLFDKQLVVSTIENPQLISQKQIDEAWEEYKLELEKGTFSDWTYQIKYPDEYFGDDEGFKIAYLKSPEYKEEKRKYEEGKVEHKFLSVAPTLTIPRDYEHILEFYYK